ncbi:hypothetical protein EPK99_23330 [Neorhizobium lilium]|uniref:Uncharacterized protein n=1 Tax=Neorhizobium lilium TaxID=2503024 RepID=A0A444LB51_9HYPH|nr:hypothetical protein [Neorhizobium lilium]RWX74830.1 hypothetical protein EPK99_23330 [Neorhizobium lilium]
MTETACQPDQRLDRFVQSIFSSWGRLRPAGLLHQFVGQSYGDRLFLHDLCHCISALGFSRRDEELTAVLQSTLSRDLTISYRTNRFPDAVKRDLPILSQFDDTYLREVERFMLHYYRKSGHPDHFPAYNNQRSSSSDIARVYRLAERVDHFCHRDFGLWFYQVPAERLKKLEARSFVSIISEAWGVQQYKIDRLFGNVVVNEILSLLGQEDQSTVPR